MPKQTSKIKSKSKSKSHKRMKGGDNNENENENMNVKVNINEIVNGNGTGNMMAMMNVVPMNNGPRNWNNANFQKTFESFVMDNMKDQPYEFYDEYLTDENREFFKKPIGLHDPLGLNVNPFTLQPYENFYSGTKTLMSGPLKGKKIDLSYKNISYIWTNQIVYKGYLNKLIQTIRDNQVTLLISGTGTGKTLLTPRAVMESYNYQKKVIITIPKKVICRSSAEFGAQCSGVRVGEEVGYYFKGDNKTSDKTKLFYTTTGSLISKIAGDDPYLKDYDCVIIDEAHERSVQTDLLLFYMKKALTVRKDLKLVIMSATISKDKFLGYFPNGNSKNNSLNNLSKAKFKTSEIDVGSEKLFSVEQIWAEKPIPQMEWTDHASKRIIDLLTTTDSGDIMCFIGSAPEGRKICNDVASKIKGYNNIHPFCVVLHGSSPKEDEDWAKGSSSLESHPNYNTTHPFTRKLVMATNVAESSITIDSIVYVIESGYHYEESYSPEECSRSLMSERISKASVKQRVGRAGRTQNGFCFHLYTQEEYERFHDYPTPDIQKSDLTDFFLDMLRLPYIENVGDIKTKILQYLIDPPEDKFVNSAIHNLHALGCIDKDDKDGKVTELGLALAKFRGVPLPFAKAILTSYYYGCKYDVMEIFSIYQELDGRIESLFDEPRKRKGMNNYELKELMRDFDKKKKKYYSKYGDFITIYEAYRAYRDFLRGPKNSNTKRTKDEVYEWFRENAINSKIFTSRMRSKKFDGINEDVMKINRVLMSIVQPPELKKEYFNQLKQMNPNISMDQIEKEIMMNEMNKGLDVESNILDDEMDITKEEMKMMKREMKMNMTGGMNMNLGMNMERMRREPPPYEKNFFPGTVLFPEKLDNIVMSLCMGLVTQMAKLVNKGRSIYKTCFPLKRMDCMFDRETSLVTKVKPSLVFYGELFQTRKDQSILKLNFVNRIPTIVMDRLKDYYPSLILEYVKKEESSYSYSNKRESSTSHSSRRRRTQKHHHHRRKRRY